MDGIPISGRGYRGIAESLEAAVRDERLIPGSAVPSVRGLATQLEVSPATVAAAYRELRLRGVLTAEPGRGTRVAPRVTVPMRAAATPDPGARDLSNGNPDPRLLPSLSQVMGRLRPRQVLYGEPAISPELLEVMAGHFSDVNVTAAQLTVVSGAMDGVERALSTHLLANDRVAVEDPCYTGVLNVLRTSGLVPVRVPIDEFGMLPDALRAALAGGARACIVSPRAQNPAGAAVDAIRARELRDALARSPDVLVIENDHTNMVSGLPYESVTSDRRRWVLVRSLSKALGPDLRLAFLAGDAATIERVERRFQSGPAWVSHLLQAAVVGLLRDPATTALTARAATVYEQRRLALIGALNSHGIAASGRSGLNVLVPVDEESQVIRAMDAAGWILRAGEPHRLASRPFVRITTAALEPHDAQRLASDLAGTLRFQRLSHPA
ncbi:MAG TPA: aminotransferase class I/II-fold pyridoxal phosphate-dependent enzyme [Streptosporangiaceae bacterium]|jgi:DNA-binding transcriptional MocR family regulator